MTHHYFSLQYSAIQKTVLRHDRLWSIAGISNILSRMNELEMPKIAEDLQGTVIVAGGGKFTACFPSRKDAEQAKRKCVELVATTLPMLEFQVSEIHEGVTFESLKKGKEGRNKLIDELGEQKRAFRGYAVSFNPHLKLCEECGEYPAQEKNRGKVTRDVCRVCHTAFEESRGIADRKKADTTLQKVYHGFWTKVPAAAQIDPPADFNDLFPNKDAMKDAGEHRRMAVWFSDLNNMNDKVPIWLKQTDETEVLSTFNKFRDTVVQIVINALALTFKKPSGDFLPFRLVVAGGDDLCLVMAEEYILDFTVNLSRSLNAAKALLDDNHPLSDAWLKKNGISEEPKPFGFGSAFVVTSVHTPFSQIHRIGEELMSTAKKTTERAGNSVNWRIMAEEHAVTEQLLSFERPLFIERSDQGKSGLNCLTFDDYLDLRKDFRGKLSSSHLQQIVTIMQKEINPYEVERQMKLLDAGEQAKSFSPLLRDPRFRDAKKNLLPQRIATLFELLAIGGDE